MKDTKSATHLAFALLVILGVGFVISLVLTAIMEIIAPGKITAFPFISVGLAGTLTGMLVRLETNIKN